MPPKTAPKAPEVQEYPELRAAFAFRDEASEAIPFDKAALEAANAALKTALMKTNFAEDVEGQPSLAVIQAAASSRNLLAAQLILRPRIQVKLHQRVAPEKPLPDEEVVINGLHIPVPRGIRLQLPDLVAEILDASQIS